MTGLLDGTLRFQDGQDSTLKARYIHVAAQTGKLLAGTTDAPFQSTARIQLFGNRETPPYPNSGLGSKFLAVFGEVSLIGATRQESTWTQPAITAVSGDDKIVVPDEWAAGVEIGDKILLSATEKVEWDSSELVAVAAVVRGSPTASIYFEKTLAYDHVGVVNATWLGTQQTFMAAEVSVVSASNIIIEGVNEGINPEAEAEFGVSVYIMQRPTSCGASVSASATIVGTNIVSCGQAGWWDRACINVRPMVDSEEWDASGSVEIRDSIISDGYGYGILVDRSHGVSIADNVIYNVHDVGIYSMSERISVMRNLVSHIHCSSQTVGAEDDWVYWFVNLQNGIVQQTGGRCHGLWIKGDGEVVRGNSVSGVKGVCAVLDGDNCGDTLAPSPTPNTNTAHNCLVGVVQEWNTGQRAQSGTRGVTTRAGYEVSGSISANCYSVTGWHIHTMVLFGARAVGSLTMVSHIASVKFSNLVIVDAGIALSAGLPGVDSNKHDK